MTGDVLLTTSLVLQIVALAGLLLMLAGARGMARRGGAE